ncbi:hypothetical protein FOXB_15099, partial [Fusarium oxysporum f. sp. conglutinans Fo5176]
MKRSTDATSRSPHTASLPSGSEQPQASDDRSRHDLQLYDETEHPRPTLASSSFNNTGPGRQFNTVGGPQYNNTGSGAQYIYTNSHEPTDPVQDCLRSLFFREMDNRYNDKNVKAATGTCEWLLQHETYKIWAACDRGLFWIKGKPGSGKSTLLRHTLDNVKKAPSIGYTSLVLSFFFYDRGNELQKTPLGLFRSLLYQLLEQAPDALLGLVDVFQQYCKSRGKPVEDWQWHLNELQRFFESSLLKVLESRPVWVFIDALDECDGEGAVDLAENFNSMLQNLPSTAIRPLHICFSCRHDRNLDLDFGGRMIDVERENKQDISTYVYDKLSGFLDRMGSTIPKLIIGRADGVFMWTRLVVERVLKLERDGEGPKRIEKEISKIPQDLYRLYDKLVQGMKKKPASLKLIQWICFATRPLSLEELRWAIIVDHDCAHKSLQQCETAADIPGDSNIVERKLKTLSRGLAEVVPSSNTLVVQFIHQSVKDFFVEKGLSALRCGVMLTDAGTANVDFVVGMAHYQLSRTCIRYLAMEEIVQSTIRDRTELMSEFPLLDYAATSWVAHAKQSETRKVCQDDLPSYFTWPSEHLVELWVQVYRIIDYSADDCPPAGTSLLHVVSRYGMVGPLRIILQRAHQARTDIDIKDKDGLTPLMWAALNGHEAVVKLLLDMDKADVKARDNYCLTPLLWAARNGHEAV